MRNEEKWSKGLAFASTPVPKMATWAHICIGEDFQAGILLSHAQGRKRFATVRHKVVVIPTTYPA